MTNLAYFDLLKFKDFLLPKLETAVKEVQDPYIGNLFWGGDPQERIIVAGAFDTWPYMDFIARVLAKNGYISCTSRFIYRKYKDNIVIYPTNLISILDTKSKNEPMIRLLKNLFNSNRSAIIVYSISAGHYIETDWAFSEINQKVIGIAFVRSVQGKHNCKYLKRWLQEEELVISTKCNVSKENVKRSAWNCIEESGFCPFINQDISKNVIEYYLLKKDFELIAISDINYMEKVLLNDYNDIRKNVVDFDAEKLGDLDQTIFEKTLDVFKLNPNEISLFLEYNGLKLLFFFYFLNQILSEHVYDKFNKKHMKFIETMTEWGEIPHEVEKNPIHFETLFPSIKSNDPDFFKNYFQENNSILRGTLQGIHIIKKYVEGEFGLTIIEFFIRKEFLEEKGPYYKITNKGLDIIKNCFKHIFNDDSDKAIEKYLAFPKGE